MAETATRATLSSNWQEMQRQIDWMSTPFMADYVNKLVSGRSLSDGGHWALYAYEKHVMPLLNKRRLSQPGQHKLSMISLACGSGHIEEALIKQFNWPVDIFLGLEYDDMLRNHAEKTFKNFNDISSKFEYFDFNKPPTLAETYDIVFCCHSLHHATDIEGLLPKINTYLKPDGIFIGIDFFGPTRFQIEYDVLPIIEELFSILPTHLRQDLRYQEGNKDHFIPASIQEVYQADPSESVRSSDLRTLLFSQYQVVDIKPMGGTLLRWLLQYRAGNFRGDSEEHIAIARLLQFIERELIESRRIRSDDLFFVLKQK